MVTLPANVPVGSLRRRSASTPDALAGPKDFCGAPTRSTKLGTVNSFVHGCRTVQNASSYWATTSSMVAATEEDAEAEAAVLGVQVVNHAAWRVRLGERVAELTQFDDGEVRASWPAGYREERCATAATPWWLWCTSVSMHRRLLTGNGGFGREGAQAHCMKRSRLELASMRPGAGGARIRRRSRKLERQQIGCAQSAPEVRECSRRTPARCLLRRANAAKCKTVLATCPIQPRSEERRHADPRQGGQTPASISTRFRAAGAH